MKKHLLHVVFLMAMVMFAGCGNWVAPKRVSVSSDATFKIPVGDISADKLLAGEGSSGSLLDGIDPEGFVSQIDPEGTLGIGVYEYTGDKKDGSDEGLTYLMHYPVASIPPDGKSLFGDIDFSPDDVMSGASAVSNDVNFSFSIPKIGTTEKVQILDLGAVKDTFMEQIKNDVRGASYDVDIPETGLPTPQGLDAMFDSNVINIEADCDGEIYYSNGSYVQVSVTCLNYITPGPDYSIRLHAYLADFDTKEALPGCDSGYVEVSWGGTLRIPFEGQLPGKLKVIVNGETSGGTPDMDHIHKYRVDLSVSDSFGIDKVTGVNATPSELGFQIDPISASKDIDDLAFACSQLKVKKGSICVKTKAPEGWDGINCTADVTFHGAGNAETALVDADEQDGYFLNKTLDLAGKELILSDTDHTLYFNGDVDFSIVNATIDFTKSGINSKVEAEVVFAIDEIEEVTLLAKQIMEYEGSLPEKVLFKTEAPSMFGDVVQSIDFNQKIHKEDGTELRDGNGYGFKFTVNNTLPEGNNIPFRFVSSYLNYDSNNCLNEDGSVITTFPVNKDGKPTDVVLTNYGLITFTKPAEGTKDYIEFKMVLPESFKLYNLKSDTNYTIGLTNIQTVLDWDKIQLDFSKPLATGNIALDGFDIGEILEGFGLTEVGLPDIEAYIFIQKSDGDFLENAKIQGKIELDYKDKNNVSKKKIILDEGDSASISSTSAFTWPEKGKPFTADIDELPYLAKINFTDLLKDDATDIKLDYDVGVSDAGSDALTIYSSSIDEMNGLNLSADIAVKIPFDLKINEPITLNLMDMIDPAYSADPTIDLLGRNSGSSDSSGSSSDPSDPYSPFAPSNGGDDDNGDGTAFDIAGVLEHIDYMSLKINLTNKLLIVENNNDEPPLKLVIKDDNLIDAAGNPFSKEIGIKTDGTTLIEFRGSELSTILDSEVFHPSIILTVGGADTSIKFNDAIFDAGKTDENLLSVNLLFELKLDGDKPFVLELGSDNGSDYFGGM